MANALRLPPRRFVALCALGSACATYGPDLLSEPGAGNAGSAGSFGTAGSFAGTGSPGGAGGSGSVAGSAAQGGDTASKPFLRAAIDEPAPSVPLSEEGALDWAHWGLASASDYNHKADIMAQLLAFDSLGDEAARLVEGPTTFTWNDGTPTPSGNSASGIAWEGLGAGFELRVPAVTTPRRLRAYCAVMAGTGRLEAELSDPRATMKVDTPLISTKAEWAAQVVTLDYGGADQPETTLRVSLVVEAMVAPTAAVAVSALTIAEP